MSEGRRFEGTNDPRDGENAWRVRLATDRSPPMLCDGQPSHHGRLPFAVVPRRHQSLSSSVRPGAQRQVLRQLTYGAPSRAHPPWDAPRRPFPLTPPGLLPPPPGDAMHRTIALSYVLATVLLAGCGSDRTTAPTQESFVGIWNLATVDGRALPYTLAQSTEQKVDVLSDRLCIQPDGNFVQLMILRTVGLSVKEQEWIEPGTYTLDGTVGKLYGSVFEFLDDKLMLTTTVSTTSITTTVKGKTWIYRKQQGIDVQNDCYAALRNHVPSGRVQAQRSETAWAG